MAETSGSVHESPARKAGVLGHSIWVIMGILMDILAFMDVFGYIFGCEPERRYHQNHP